MELTSQPRRVTAVHPVVQHRIARSYEMCERRIIVVQVKTFITLSNIEVKLLENEFNMRKFFNGRAK